MWEQVVYLLEIFATLACVHSIYGKKVCWDVKPIALCLSLLIIYEVANGLPNGGIFSIIAFIPIFIYCRMVFKVSVMQTVLKMLWFIILLTAIEFMCAILVASIIPQNILVRNVIVNLLVLVVSVAVLPQMHISKIELHERTAKIFLGIVWGIVFLLILVGKITQKINIALFILVMPVLLMMLYILVKWAASQTEADNMKQEVSVVKKMDEKYLELLDDIRIKQHGFKNHITAIFSAHYTYKTYEKLVEVQDEYCNRLIQENKYNNLLQIGDRLLAGFLYDKFCQIEDDQIEIGYKINAFVKGYAVPTYYLIEILGILLDNATEAVKHEEKKKIIFIVSEHTNRYLFMVRNISMDITYAEIEGWFQKGVSSKGKNRGLGLFHAKSLCQEFNCDISGKIMEYEQEKWVEFCLEIDKADRM